MSDSDESGQTVTLPEIKRLFDTIYEQTRGA